nr:hypothetical protein GCM10023233_17960 [Brevibacterium otitidis]
MRGELFLADLPARRTRAERFAALAARLFEQIRLRADGELADVRLAVDLVPPPAPEVELGRIFPARPDRPATVVIYRLPVVSRCQDFEELNDLVAEVLAEQAAVLCGRHPDELLP